MSSSALNGLAGLRGRWWQSGAVWAMAGMLAMYLPVYLSAASTLWDTDENAHAPLVLAIAVWLFWGLRQALAEGVAAPSAGAGWSVFVFGLLSYILGRSLGVSVLVFGSQLFIVGGVLLLLKGAPALRLAWFPVFYLVFMIPLPGTLIDAATGPLKQWVSVIVETLLFAVGYPIARSGVVISIGQYQMLVADACSGLHSMFSLAALGSLFMYLMGRPSRLHNAVMIAAIAPIAFAANIVRVMVLVLITYHLGDEAGQGFLHGAAGIVLMLVALVAFFALDALLLALLRPASPRAVADRS
ncbi:MAG TPA: exosortase B [Methylibium sp.]|nr:exosortase B [Methylibium sp.]